MKKPRKLQGRLRKSVFLLPSLFTSGNLLLGFYSIVLAYHGKFTQACLWIFLAAIIDMLDGRIARMTGTESDFGREFDSLADLTTFGTAPAFVCYFWGLEHLGRAGWIVPLLYLLCAASRLARFNVQASVTDSRFFVGMPAPAAACSLLSILFAFPRLEGMEIQWQRLLLGLVTGALLFIGGLMVSTFRYRSFKNVDLRRSWSYRIVVPISIVVLAIALRPEAFFLSIAILYTFPPPLAWLWGRLRRGSSSPPEEDASSQETEPS